MKRMTVLKKIIISILIVLVINIISVFVITALQIENISTDIYATEIQRHFEYTNAYIYKALEISHNSKEMNDAITKYENAYPYKLTVVVNNKDLYGDFLTWEQFENIGNQAGQGYITFEGKKFFYIIYQKASFNIPQQDSDGYYRIYTGTFQFVIGKEVPVFSEQMIRIISFSLVAVLLISFPTLFILLLFFRKMTMPIVQISAVAGQIADGNYSERIPVKTKDEIGDLALAINNMVNKLKENEIARDAFLAGVSHELRTPLTTIKANTRGIIEGVIPKEQAEEYLLSNLEETDRLTNMVNDLILASSFEQNNNLAIEKVDLSNFIYDTVRQIEIIARQKEITIITEVQPMLLGEIDKQKFKQVLVNILDNAIKFSPHGSTVTISAEKSFERIIIKITDNGGGIEFEDPNRIFSRFNKGRTSQGLGLGLYISKLIVQAHKGEITAYNHDTGATIQITI